MKDTVIILPFPPSVNQRLAHVKNHRRAVLSKKFRDYYKVVQKIVNNRLPKIKTIEQKIDVMLLFAPPDKRRRDYDNYLKALNDSLKYAHVIKDDSLFKRIWIEWLEPCNSGQVTVVLGKSLFEIK